ncbi:MULTISPECIES: hypothetical protein [Paraburkholderia]|uniref:Uncharacterized protein n=1 Tax=Paraburkholderia madseniana TaxID=2599607 RepID=A0AAP5BF05_9BURK|nr:MULTISPECIES: hypothetical protein [Paraburkholderia]MCX4146927.1 hypothetical protein [Paraburkholderia madseniana]MDN7149872.1 hypothetical protein [Paraburkholderia sp. WS6]MDQ6408752.1 hypothetical protein [Paraburkholderia madseniana]
MIHRKTVKSLLIGILLWALAAYGQEFPVPSQDHELPHQEVSGIDAIILPRNPLPPPGSNNTNDSDAVSQGTQAQEYQASCAAFYAKFKVKSSLCK